MKRFIRFSAAVAVGVLSASSALAWQPQTEPPAPPMPPAAEDANDSADDEQNYVEESNEQVDVLNCDEDDAADESCSSEDSCADDVACGEEAGCGDGCEAASNGSLCCGWNWCGDCCEHGDPWTLKGWLTPCKETHNYGGWFQGGYHSHVTGQSQVRGDLLDFNDVPHDFNLHQAWFYSEKLAEADACSADWGYRFDILYGTDAQKTQAFGNSGAPDAQGWDNDWDHGVYGWAIPQLYGEVAFGDWSVKVGHFFTPLGYEVIPAPSNFFYSHALTMFNSEPFTHTGVLGTYNGIEGATVYTGWTLGWDTGFDQYRGGNNFLGGFTRELNEDLSFTYLCTAGNFGFRSGDEFGYSHAIVMIADLSDKWKYVFQSDYVNTEGSFGDPDEDGEDVGVNQYLFYTISDCWSLGGRMEWWRSDTSAYNPGEHTSYYELTGGINYKPHANVVFRPEIRYDWSPTEFDDPDYNRAIFGIDVICTY